MPRDSNNTYTLPEAPFQPNTVAQPTPVNNNFSDIANALTASLTRGETTAFSRSLLDDADAATARGTLGGTATGVAVFTAADAAAARTAIGATATGGAVMTAADAAAARTAIGATATGNALFTAADLAAAQSALSTSWSLCEAPRVVSAVTQVDFALPTAFRAYRLQVLDMVPSVNVQRLLGRFSNDNGATFLATANYTAFGHEVEAGAPSGFQVQTLSELRLTGQLNNAAQNAMQGEYIITPGSTSVRARLQGLATGANGTPFFSGGHYHGVWEGTLARMNAMRLFVSSGNLSGTFILEGLR
jgi:hypothetical protein